jgi:hypothetical protein
VWNKFFPNVVTDVQCPMSMAEVSIEIEVNLRRDSLALYITGYKQ